jgi:signal transduction histidine kinase
VEVSIDSDRKRNLAILNVHDFGRGIDPAEQKRIFKPFVRGGAGRGGLEARGLGLGLGLYIVREIVTAHDGEIRVMSSPGRGSVFTVELPLT